MRCNAIDGFAAALRRWATENRRDLPWRRTRDPWAILVSEFMLQQTQVARVVPKWNSFVERFPTPSACAAVPVSETIRMWGGLGYNRRAVQLHAAAVAIADDYGDAVPSTLNELCSLPGVGPYTARAIRVFAYEHDDAVVDTNVARILARAVAGRRLSATEAQETADALVPFGEGWSWNQGLLDLGATICTKVAPKCAQCPVSSKCRWRVAAHTETDPALGSAGVPGRQSPFEGSDRQGRGRLVSALCESPVLLRVLPAVMGWRADWDRSIRIASTVVDDGLAEWDETGTALRLIGTTRDERRV